ncbi:MAG: ABC transporter ATP-binding protein [Candidatus Nezhaarchaeota archaeon]|nr:ABC transporter ATP-binding protein [Candidatus Nezhaarchaeota archaeon]MCX8142175.1 ABC transporter ATP-binding protein [Candidatus Nezhaarchaeota archaeon]MDW8050042.1 ABC transporter ATP-binding protein [Nitrososphaerota archaeon]
MNAIVSKGVWKRYGNGVIALRGVSFSVERGRLVALIGRNGAGKTTWIRIASTQLLPTSGTVEVMGFDVLSDPWSVREVIAMVPQEGMPMDLLTPFEFVYSYLMIRGYERGEAKSRAREFLELLELDTYANVMIGELSGGLKRRVMVAAVLASGAEVLFLDEPTTGLDPLARRSVWRILREAKKNSEAVLLTTHYMDEAESLADDVVLIHDGRVMFIGPVNDALKAVGSGFKVEVYGDLNIDGYDALRLKGITIFYVNEGEAEEVLKMAIKRGYDVTVKSTGLEDLFIKMTGERIEEGG